ncbi:keratin, type II cytoskeletal 1-like [Venturia canescens]|uniref:keratin, type II cytoskeletal 1-like n=1 Tax=Venturia canescens TaxID=32260 RepID=UPI001C9C9013|nr:keratin, type II cytoskeletal 1-like [Venturia canescens]
MSSGGGPVFFVKKRERTQNWVPEEKNALLALIAKHIDTLENKRLDTAVTTMKNLAWEKIYRDFRRKFTAERDITKIKAQWSRMKSQARLEMYTFAAKVKVLGSDEAAKHAPSSLSISVWRLLQNLRKNDYDGERSDESSQDADVANDVDAILDKLPASYRPEITNFPEIKTERLSNDDFGEEIVTGNHVNNVQYTDEVSSRKRASGLVDYEDVIDHSGRKQSRVTYENRNFEHPGHEDEDREKNAVECSLSPEDISHMEMPVQHATWMFEAAQREHKLKIRMLEVELERAELDKQKAINELKTSEIKRKLVEDEAAERASQVRMSGEAGSGAGRGGGGGGSIRSAGGSFGKMEAAHEDQYFYNQQKEQLQKLREGLHDEISFHEEQIKRHQEAITRHKERIDKMEK